MTSFNANRKIPARSEEFFEFIHEQPRFLLKWGLTIIFFIFLSLLGATFFISYPEEIFAEAKIRSSDTPKKILAFSKGKIVKILIRDNSLVRQGEIIGFLESTASHEEVIRLGNELDSLRKLVKDDNFEEVAAHIKNSQLQSSLLGELQKGHKTFMESFDELMDYLKAGAFIDKREILTQNLESIESLMGVLKEQKILQTKDVEIADENFRVSDTLHQGSVISRFEYRAKESQLLGKQLAIPNTDIAILKNQQEANNVKQQLIELENEIIRKKKDFERSLNVYSAEIEQWKRRFLLVSPTTGKLVYMRFLENFQEVAENELIGYVVNEKSFCYAEMYISQHNIGKIILGQQITLKFPAYPYFEYGSLSGEIQSIKNILTDSGYLSKVSISKHKNSTLRDLVELKDGLKANAHIIIHDGTLIEYLLNKF